MLSPEVPNAHGCPRQPCFGKAPFREHMAQPPKSQFSPHVPTHSAERGQDWTLSRHMHMPAWSRKGIHSQDTAPGAQRSVIPGPLALQAQPEPAQPVTPLCLWANPRGWLRCWMRTPLPPVRTTAQPQHPGPGPWHPEPLTNLPLARKLVLVLSELLLCLGLNEAKRHIFACSWNKLERREKLQLQRLFQEGNAAAQAQTQPREDQSPQLGPEPSTGVGQVQGDLYWPQVLATFPQLLTLT